MGIAQDLQKQTLQLRKDRDPVAAGFQTVLTFAQASAKERGLKGGSPAINDEDALRAVQRGIKMCRDVLDAKDTIDMPLDHKERLAREQSLLEALLPEMADEMEVRAEVGRFIGGNPELIGSKKAMGDVMKYLSERFGTSLDKAAASRIAREALDSL